MARPSLSFPCLSALSLAAGLAHAQPNAFWCGTQLIREGMAAAEVIERCGEPASVERIEEPIFARNVSGGAHQIGVKRIELWTYDRGAGRFPARITVEDGVATEVELLRR